MSDQGRQLNVFGPSLNPIPRLKEAMRQAIKGSRFSREQICDRINAILANEGLRVGRSDKVSLASLDSWVAASKDSHLISLALLPAFCSASESLIPIKVLAQCLGAEVIGSVESNILALAKLELEAKALAKKRRRLQRELEEAL